MDEVKNKHLSFIITKHGVPIAKLTSIDDEPFNLFGALKDTAKIKGDIVAPINEKSDAES